MIGDRIKTVRNSLGYNQTDFGNKIGVAAASISKLEKGINNPSDQTVKLICSEFGISRHWLETGEGEMIDPQIESDIELLTRAMEGQSEAKKKFLRIVAGMPDDLLEAVLAHLEKTLETKNTP